MLFQNPFSSFSKKNLRIKKTQKFHSFHNKPYSFQSSKQHIQFIFFHHQNKQIFYKYLNITFINNSNNLIFNKQSEKKNKNKNSK